MAAPQQEAQEPTEVPYQKLTNEIDLILSDPDTELSIGAKRALLWVRTWVSVPLFTAPQPAPAPLSDEREAFEAWFRQEYHSRLDRNMPDKSYNDPKAYTMWIAWQARAAIAAQGGK